MDILYGGRIRGKPHDPVIPMQHPRYPGVVGIGGERSQARCDCETMVLRRGVRARREGRGV